MRSTPLSKLKPLKRSRVVGYVSHTEFNEGRFTIHIFDETGDLKAVLSRSGMLKLRLTGKLNKGDEFEVTKLEMVK